MKITSLDFETYCDLDIKKVGAARYTRDPSFKVRIASANGVIYGETGLPLKALEEVLKDSDIIVAHNVSFERHCCRALVRRGIWSLNIDDYTWRCTMVAALYFALPASLDAVCRFLKLSELKLPGGLLLNYWSKPPYHLPQDDKEKWALFISYCSRDEACCLEIWETIGRFVPEDIWDEYFISEEINNYGVAVDLFLVSRLKDLCSNFKEEARAELQLYGMTNPNSRIEKQKLLGLGVDDSVSKESRSILRDKPELAHILDLLDTIADTTDAKYTRILDCHVGGILYDMFFFHGARTGRFSGRMVQLQNLKRSNLEGVPDDISSMDIASKCTRFCFVARLNKKLCIMDFKAIEARVLAWLAGEQWALDVFATTGLIYEQTAARMYNVALEDVTPELRQKGKTAVLALGYQGGVEGLRDFDSSIEYMAAKEIVNSWRKANYNIVKYWGDCMLAFSACALDHSREYNAEKTKFIWDDKINGVAVILPVSGRRIHYPNVVADGNGGLSYAFVNVSGQIVQREVYGGNIAQNITQAVARDIIMYALKACKRECLNVVMHVHDEVVVEIEEGQELTAEACMLEAADRYQGLPLACSLSLSAIYNK